MEIKNAIWEKRNLGVDCNEVEIGSDDTLITLKNNISQFETEYTVVKVPVGMTDISYYLQSSGYVFMELITTCFSRGKLPDITPIQKRIVESVSYDEMNEKDLDKLRYEINQGMFQQDRICLDPHFSQDQANRRYVNWISDEIKRGSKIFKLVYKGNAEGFFTFEKNDNFLFRSSLGALYPSFDRSGFGICLNYYIICEGIKNNAKKILTGFSSNNRGPSAMHFSLGLTLDKQYYVFVKHM